jgi:hypothetical protein
LVESPSSEEVPLRILYELLIPLLRAEVNNGVGKSFKVRGAREVMRVALIILCIGAVMFFSRVVAALLKEGLSWRPIVGTAHSAKFNRSTERGKLLEMKTAGQWQKQPVGTGKQMAL